VTLESLWPNLVRRVAWSGDRRNASVRLEIGAGELSGATLLVQADERRVRVELCTPPGVDPRGWSERITQCLTARGLLVDEVSVS
jgi:hypothetical protein